jgi:hypothetical protein
VSEATQAPEPSYFLFISWSTKPVRDIAFEFKYFFEKVLPPLSAFVSDRDIHSGEEWFSKIRKAIKQVEAGVVLLTPWNAYEPWLLAEAGALISREKKCCPILLIPEKEPKVADFFKVLQAQPFEKDRLLQVVEGFNERAGFLVSEEELKLRFDKHWRRLEKKVRKLQSALKIEPPPARVMHSDFVPKLPDTLQFLYDRWQKVGKDSDFRLETFVGIGEDEYESFVGIGEDKNESHGQKAAPAFDRAGVLRLWADPQGGRDAPHEPPCAIVAQFRTDRNAPQKRPPKYFLRVQFTQQAGTRPCNVTVRPIGRRLLRKSPDGFEKLSFKVRIPSDRDQPDAERVYVAMRIIDCRQTHWKFCDDGIYHWHECAASKFRSWRPLTYNLKDPDSSPVLAGRSRRAHWKVFDSDGNWRYHDEKPDFTSILAVVIEVAASQNENPDHSGRGMIDFKDFEVK